MTNKATPATINGWTVLVHPLFLAQLEKLTKQVEALQKKDPSGYIHKNPTKRLQAIHNLAFNKIPMDPTLSEYRQGDTLGADHKHWFRAKIFQQYRLFFRYDLKARIIILAWVNGEDTKRAYDSSTDAYAVFRKMLGKSKPPTDWPALMAEAEEEAKRLAEVRKKKGLPT